MQNFISSLVITLREGIEGAIAVAIVLLYLRKTGRQHLAPAVWWGLGLALAASLLGAWVLQNLPVNGEILEGILMFVAAIFVGTMIVWMWKSAKGLKKEIESRVEEITSGAGTDPGKAGWMALFLFTFLMIVREGIETVIFLGAVNVTNLTSDSIVSFLGGLLGLVLAVLFGFFFMRGSLRIDLGRFFKITGIVLLVFVAQLIIGGIHELGEGGLIDIGPRGMAIVGPIVKNNALFMVGILLIPVLMLLIPSRSAPAGKMEGGSRSEQRLAEAAVRRQKIWRTSAAVLAMFFIVFITMDLVYSQSRTLTPPEDVTAADGKIRIPLNRVLDGNLHRFRLADTPVRFIVLKMENGEPGVALDACEICGVQGYVMESGALICLNCAADINTATISQGGGCNPIPLQFQKEGSDLVILTSNLEKETKRFSVQHEHH